MYIRRRFRPMRPTLASRAPSAQVFASLAAARRTSRGFAVWKERCDCLAYPSPAGTTIHSISRQRVPLGVQHAPDTSTSTLFLHPPPVSIQRCNTGHGPARRWPPGRVRPYPRGVCACRTGRKSGGGPATVLLRWRRLLPHAAPSPPASGRRERRGPYRPICPARLRRQPVLPGGREVVRIPGGGVPAAGEAGSGGRCRGWEQLWRGLCGQNPKSSVQNAGFSIATGGDVLLLRRCSLAAFSRRHFSRHSVAFFKQR